MNNDDVSDTIVLLAFFYKSNQLLFIKRYFKNPCSNFQFYFELYYLILIFLN